MELKRKVLEFAKPLVERFPLLAMIYRTMRDSRDLLKEPKMTPMGFKFIGSPAMERGVFEIEEVEVVREYLKSVDIFINVGANVGYYCCLALKLGKKVIAFEPIDLNLKYLYRNIRANKWSEAEIYPMGLSNKIGLTEIYGGGVGASLIKGWAGNSQGVVNLIPTTTLDTVLGDRLLGSKCFFLVDIEGAEKYMLEGAGKQLELIPRPVWMVEVCVSEHQPEGLSLNPYLQSTFKMFWDRGYKAITANKQARLVTEEEILKITETGIDTLGTHNFLFISKS